MEATQKPKMAIMGISRNNKVLGDIELSVIPALGSKITYKGKKYTVKSYLIKESARKSRKILEVE